MIPSHQASAASLDTPQLPDNRQVAVAMVLHDSAADLPDCLRALAGLAVVPAPVVIVDCASSDGGADFARRLAGELGLAVEVVELGQNRGFAGGMNAALTVLDRRDAGGHPAPPWVLLLNADVRLDRWYVERLLDRATRSGAAAAGLRIGALTGRLLRFAAPGQPDVLDACGMRLTRTWRHLDRGSGERDRGQLQAAERVFGGTGAATLFARAALADVAIDGAVFDDDFFAFREDAELALRLQERGWEALYEPAALARHRRSNVPASRRVMSALVNYHSLKNRYLLRLHHETWRSFLATSPFALLRDLAAFVYVMWGERSSLAAYRWLWQQRRRLLARAKQVRARRTAPAGVVERWFRCSALPLPGEPTPAAETPRQGADR